MKILIFENQFNRLFQTNEITHDPKKTPDGDKGYINTGTNTVNKAGRDLNRKTKIKLLAATTIDEYHCKLYELYETKYFCVFNDANKLGMVVTFKQKNNLCFIKETGAISSFRGIGLAEKVYEKIIEVVGCPILSGEDQTENSKKLWTKLYIKYPNRIHGFNLKTSKIYHLIDAPENPKIKIGGELFPIYTTNSIGNDLYLIFI